MKKIIALSLLLAMALFAFASCGEKIDAEFVKMDTAVSANVHFTKAPDASVDVDAFIEAYNEAEFVKGCKDSYGKKTTKVTVVSFEDDNVFTLYEEKKNRFVVETNLADANYIIESEELYVMYKKAIGEMAPDAVFVKLGDNEEYNVNAVLYPDAEIDAEAFVKAYNGAKFIEGTHENASAKYKDVVVIVSDSTAIVLYYAGENTFYASTELSDADYIIESAELADLYKALEK